VVNAGVTIVNDMVQIEATLNDLQASFFINTTIGPQVQDGINYGNSTLKVVEDARDQIFKYESYR
jgi:hypothetical protein